MSCTVFLSVTSPRGSFTRSKATVLGRPLLATWGGQGGSLIPDSGWVISRQHTDHWGWQTVYILWKTLLRRLSGENTAFWDDEGSPHAGAQLSYTGTALLVLPDAERSVFISTIQVTSEAFTLIPAHFPLTPYSHPTTSAAGSPGLCLSKSNWSHVSWGSICFKIWGVVSDTNVRNKKEMVTSSSETTGLRAKYTPQSKWT